MSLVRYLIKNNTVMIFLEHAKMEILMKFNYWLNLINT